MRKEGKMPDPDENRIRDEAIAWHVRLAGANSDKWAEFAQWLESDPRHNPAYEAVADDDAYLEAALKHDRPIEHAANDDGPVAAGLSGGKIWRWPAIAASLALLVSVALFMVAGSPDRYEVATAAGETRTVALEGGSAVMLNGDTELELDRNDPRYAELLSGEAHFNVRHDSTDPFTVVVGEQRIVDVGTAFNLALDANVMTLEVVEGVVHYDGFGQAFDMEAGATLSATSGDKLVLGEKPPASMAGWTRGELVYQGEKLSKVGRDVQRASGVSIAVSPDIAEREFSGVIQTKGDREVLRRRLESLLGVHVTETSDGWTFEP